MKSGQLLSYFAMLLPTLMHAQPGGEIIRLPFDPSTNCQIRYYYYPNLEAYYDGKSGLYFYKDNGSWTSDKQIPSGYRGYGLFNKANIAINDYDDDDVIQFIESHRKKYPYNSLRKIKNASTASID